MCGIAINKGLPIIPTNANATAQKIIAKSIIFRAICGLPKAVMIPPKIVNGKPSDTIARILNCGIAGKYF